ncbi:MAG: glycosyltransferase [Victivallaceae bacterium]|nr:glycosyltransferase [Victivallaceae bacterium]
MFEYDEIKKVSVVVPVFNEEACLKEFIQRTLDACRSLNKQFEIILTDDGSQDNSANIIQQFATDNPGEVIGCILNRNYGQHAAIMAGFSIVEGDLTVTIDADLQNPPEEIPKLVIEAEKGFDVIGTVRENRQDSLFRRVASFIVNRATQHATGIKMKDYGCMLRAYRRHIVAAMLECHERSTFIPVLGNSFARNTAEIDVKHSERAAGDSKYSLLSLINLQFNLLTCMTTAPLRMLSFAGGCMSAAGIVLAIYIFIMRLIAHGDWSEGGIFTLFAILFVFMGVQMIGMGLLGEYIGRIYHDVRARPRYFIQKIVGKKL